MVPQGADTSPGKSGVRCARNGRRRGGVPSGRSGRRCRPGRARPRPTRPAAMRRRMPAPGRSPATVMTRSTVVCRAATCRWVSVAARIAGTASLRRVSSVSGSSRSVFGSSALATRSIGPVRFLLAVSMRRDRAVEPRDRLVEPLERVVEVLHRRRELADQPRVLLEHGPASSGPARRPTSPGRRRPGSRRRPTGTRERLRLFRHA